MDRIDRIAKRIAADAGDECLEAVADYLGVEPDEVVSSGDHEYRSDEMEFLVYDDEEKATNAAIESVENTIEECGVECVNGWENFIDTDYFDYDRREYWRDYANDIYSEDDDIFENRLVREMFDARLLSDDDFTVGEDGMPDYKDCLKKKDELVDEYGEYCYENDDPIEFIKESYPDDVYYGCPGCVKLGELAEYVVNIDGRGVELSVYDGKEIVHKFNGVEYYIYRMN